MISAAISLARSAAVVSVKNTGLPVPATKMNDAALLKVADGAAEDERLATFAFRSRLHPYQDAGLPSWLCRARPLMTVASIPM